MPKIYNSSVAVKSPISVLEVNSRYFLYFQDYTPTGFDTYTSTYEATDTYTIKLSLWDTSGKDEYSRVRPLSYNDADIILLCFSVGVPESLDRVVSKWYPEIRENCPNQPIILVGCQKDLRENKSSEKLKKKDPNVVSYEQGVKTAKLIDAVMYSEVSAKTSHKSVKDVIEVAAMSSAGCKLEKKSSTFRRRRASFQRKRFSEIGDAKKVLRNEAAKSCAIM
ncbi:rho-related GTP-binding protein RhoE-like [Ruditapes philippinarum]|uniref:rho-related GTP-binding protein RhoE-like n=1 Tax=Ruditapes philippinarum TaxID=129788 RepID=UPI00295C0113|nr:rho-related GTP-binding protein RhoE-like [Ruditapes philippinarum]